MELQLPEFVISRGALDGGGVAGRERTSVTVLAARESV